MITPIPSKQKEKKKNRKSVSILNSKLKHEMSKNYFLLFFHGRRRGDLITSVKFLLQLLSLSRRQIYLVSKDCWKNKTWAVFYCECNSSLKVQYVFIYSQNGEGEGNLNSVDLNLLHIAGS